MVLSGYVLLRDPYPRRCYNLNVNVARQAHLARFSLSDGLVPWERGSQARCL